MIGKDEIYEIAHKLTHDALKNYIKSEDENTMDTMSYIAGINDLCEYLVAEMSKKHEELRKKLSKEKEAE